MTHEPSKIAVGHLRLQGATACVRRKHVSRSYVLLLSLAVAGLVATVKFPVSCFVEMTRDSRWPIDQSMSPAFGQRTTPAPPVTSTAKEQQRASNNHLLGTVSSTLGVSK